MPSPFPGMDPFLELQDWEDFHTTFNTVLREALVPALDPKYVVRVERRVYVENPLSDEVTSRRADVAILHAPELADATSAASVATLDSPAECLVPMPEEHREAFLVIRLRDSLEVVTILETLSPANKRPGSIGQHEYLQKRLEVLRSATHLVEFDLLRGGDRMPITGRVPAGDYYAMVSRDPHRPRVHVYAWTIRDALPKIPVPLHGQDPEVVVDLQQVFTTVFDRARYPLTLDYRRPLVPPLSAQDAAWVAEITKPAPKT